VTAPPAEQVITLQLRPRQAVLVNMVYGLSAAILCGDEPMATRITESLHNYMLRFRREAPEEVREITQKISNLRIAFTDEQLRAMNITNYRLDLATGDWLKERP
jgi:allophanate hydrolase subunit 1